MTTEAGRTLLDWLERQKRTTRYRQDSYTQGYNTALEVVSLSMVADSSDCEHDEGVACRCAEGPCRYCGQTHGQAAVRLEEFLRELESDAALPDPEVTNRG